MIKNSILILGALLLMSINTSVADEVINFDEAAQPFMVGSGDEVKGLYPLLISEACKRMNTKCILLGIPWKRAVFNIDKGIEGVGGIYKTTERLKSYDFSNSLFVEKLNVYVVKGKSFTLNSVADLDGKTVGTLSGYSYGDEFSNALAKGNFKIEEAGSDDANFNKLILGRVNVIIAVKDAGDALVKKYSDKVEALPRSLLENEGFLAFNKSANKKDFLQKFNETITLMKKDGSFKKLTLIGLGN